jgi:hypothetical protein
MFEEIRQVVGFFISLGGPGEDEIMKGPKFKLKVPLKLAGTSQECPCLCTPCRYQTNLHQHFIFPYSLIAQASMIRADKLTALDVREMYDMLSQLVATIQNDIYVTRMMNISEDLYPSDVGKTWSIGCLRFER